MPQDTLGLTEFLSTEPEAGAAEETTTEGSTEETTTEEGAAGEETPAAEAASEEDSKPEETTEDAGEGENNTPVTDWESDDNPYKARFGKMEKQYSETRNWATQVNQQVKELTEQVRIAGLKADGTYDPEKDKPTMPDATEVANNAALQAKVKSSIVSAGQMYGDDVVHQTLFADEAPFRQFDNDQVVQQRVLASDAPAVEAMRFMKEETFFQKYGRDPDQIIANIEKDLRPKIAEEESKKLSAGLKKRAEVAGKEVNGVAAGRGAPGETRKSHEGTGDAPVSLNQIVGGNIA